MEYLKFGKNFKTDRQWKIIAIDYRQLNGINIDPKRLNYDSVRFSNIPEDIHIIACWLDYLKLSCNFLIEHDSFPRTPEGAEIEIYNSYITYYNLLIKLPKNL